MKLSIKHFLQGAAFAFIPMSIYVYISIKPDINNSNEVASYREEYLRTEEIIKSLNPTYIPPSPTPTSNPRKTPQTKPTDKLTLSPRQIQTAVYSIHTEGTNEVQALIEKYAIEYRVNKDMMIHIARCESNFRSNAVNGPYAGIYQFISSTWKSNRKAMGQDTNPDLRFNANEAVRTAAFKMARDGFSAWPVCSRKAIQLLGAK